MTRISYLIGLVVSVIVLALGILFLCAAISVPERWPLALVLLVAGAIGAGANAYLYRRYTSLQPGNLSVGITELAHQNNGEVGLSQAMSVLGVPADAATAAFEELVSKGQCHRELRQGQVIYVFPALQEHKMVRRCMYCGSTFPVKTPLQKCPNCGGTLELVKV